MTAPVQPATILLATDLSHRCDRALDRAVQLARNWNAKLLVVHAVEEEIDDMYQRCSPYDFPSWRRPVDPVRTVRDRLYQDLMGEDHGLDIEIHVETGNAATIILDTAARTNCDLIVTGVARDETLGRMILGDTVDHLARKSPIPMLIVRERLFGPYKHLLVSTDFSPSSRLALETAVRFFPKAPITLFHAYDVPFASYLGRLEVAKQLEACELEASDKFLQEAGLSPESASQVVRLVEHGVPEVLLHDYATRTRHHLVVVGSHGGGALYHALIGSTARKIIDAVPGDALLVPSARQHRA